MFSFSTPYLKHIHFFQQPNLSSSPPRHPKTRGPRKKPSHLLAKHVSSSHDHSSPSSPVSRPEFKDISRSEFKDVSRSADSKPSKPVTRSASDPKYNRNHHNKISAAYIFENVNETKCTLCIYYTPVVESAILNFLL